MAQFLYAYAGRGMIWVRNTFWIGASLVALVAAQLALTASPATAQTPTAPANGTQVASNDVVLRWTLPAGGWYTECVEWAARPETSFTGGPFLARDGGTCDLGPQDVAYLLDGLDVQRYYWHVRVARDVCDTDTDDCDYQQTWGPTAYFDNVPPPPPPPPTGCTSRAAEYYTYERLLPYAHKRYPGFYKYIDDDAWSRVRQCRDLDGDGDREMLIRLPGGTGGATSPWAIFKHDEAGQWRMAYADVGHTVWKLKVRHRVVRAMMPAPYEGACTRYIRYREVRWRHGRFRSHITKRKRLHPGC